MDAKRWENDLSLFSKDLIADLFSRHPVLCTLSQKPTGSVTFHDDIGKCVLLAWRKRKNEFDQNLKRDFPAFVESEHGFKQYLKRYVDVEIQSEHSVFSQIIELSAVLLEILFFIYRKGIVHFLSDASSYLSFVLFNIKADEFYEEGGWLQLIALSTELSRDYDDDVCKQYISEYVCIISAFDETASIDSNLETLKEKSLKFDSSMSQSKVKLCSPDKKEENLTERTEKHSKEVVSILNKPEEEINRDLSSEGIVTEVKENSTEDVSMLKKPDNELKKYPKSNEATLENVKDVSMLKKPDNELKKYPTSNEATLENVKENSQNVVPILSKSENDHEKDPSSEETTEVKYSQEVELKDQEVVEVREDAQEGDIENVQKVAVKENAYDIVDIKENANEFVDAKENANEVVGIKENGNEVMDGKEKANEVMDGKEKANEVVDVKEKANEVVDVKEKANDVVDVKEKANDVVDVKEKANDVVDVTEKANDVVDVTENANNLDVKEDENNVQVKESDKVVAEVKESDKVVAEVKESDKVVAEVKESDQQKSDKAIKTDLLSEATAETKTASLKQPNVLAENSLIKVSSDLAETESNESKLDLVKTNEHLKATDISLSPPSVHVLDLVSVSKVEFQSTDSSNSSLGLSISQNNSESLKTEEKLPSPDDNSSCKYTTHSTSPTDSELAKELDKFLIDEITTHFQVRFLSEEEIEAINSFPEDAGKKDCNVPALKQDEAIQADLMSLNNQSIPTSMNLANGTILAQEKQISAEHISTNDYATKRDENMFKSPKPECNKKATPNKTKTPLAEKGDKDERGKTTAPHQNKNVTPLKTPTGTSKSLIVSSTGKNVKEEKTPIKLKSNAVSSKSSSPCFKTPTDKGISKVHSKSCEKTERNQILSAPKALVEMAKSSPKSASATDTKSRRGEFPSSSKPLPIVVHPKLGEKEPSNNLKSCSIASELIPQSQVTATDKPITSENRKSTNTKSGNCQKNASQEKADGSSSAKSSDQSESKTPKISQESLNTKSCKSSSCIKKCDQPTGNEPSKTASKSTVSNTVRRARNVPEKNVSSDPKSGKPRWR